MQNALSFLVRTLAEFYLATFVLRFVMQWVRADSYNPLAQFILKVTSPLVAPARRLLPSVGNVDAPTLVVLVALQAVATWLLLMLERESSGLGEITIVAFLGHVAIGLVSLVLLVYTFVIFIYVLMSLLNRGYNPIQTWLGQIAEPLLKPVRRAIPPIGGLDLSPVIVLVLLQAVRILVLSYPIG